jgi:hypothetical protein
MFLSLDVSYLSMSTDTSPRLQPPLFLSCQTSPPFDPSSSFFTHSTNASTLSSFRHTYIVLSSSGSQQEASFAEGAAGEGGRRGESEENELDGTTDRHRAFGGERRETELV